MLIGVVIALFIVYVVATAWYGRAALQEQEPLARQQAAVRFLIVASLGVPILVLLIFAV